MKKKKQTNNRKPFLTCLLSFETGCGYKRSLAKPFRTGFSVFIEELHILILLIFFPFPPWPSHLYSSADIQPAIHQVPAWCVPGPRTAPASLGESSPPTRPGLCSPGKPLCHFFQGEYGMLQRKEKVFQAALTLESRIPTLRVKDWLVENEPAVGLWKLPSAGMRANQTLVFPGPEWTTASPLLGDCSSPGFCCCSTVPLAENGIKAEIKVSN